MFFFSRKLTISTKKSICLEVPEPKWKIGLMNLEQLFNGNIKKKKKQKQSFCGDFWMLQFSKI